jgi:dTDP-4-amino-4,6-dideoxygalactose transaminase
MIELPTVPDRAEHNGHMTFFFVRNRSLRDDLLGYLKAMGVPAAFHYVPLHSSPYGQRLGYTARDLPVTEELASRLIRMPMFIGMRSDQIEFVVTAIYDFFSVKRPH